MERRLPEQYAGWQEHEPALRRMTTPELVAEIQDGPPDRRLAALSVIDLGEVDLRIIEDWIRTLPEAEANELAGAIPAQRPHATCAEDVRWIEVARLGYEARRLPTFLVMLFSSLEALESRGCAEAAQEWERIGRLAWRRVRPPGLPRTRATRSRTSPSSCSRNYLAREAMFEAFLRMIVRHEVASPAR